MERVIEILRARTETVAAGTRDLLERLSKRNGKAAGRHAFVDLALGAESHVSRHLVHLALRRKAASLSCCGAWWELMGIEPMT